MPTLEVVLPDADGYTPNGWVNPYPHDDAERPCTGMCCDPNAYPQPIRWSCSADHHCPAKLRSPGECINCCPSTPWFSRLLL